MSEDKLENFDSMSEGTAEMNSGLYTMKIAIRVIQRLHESPRYLQNPVSIKDMADWIFSDADLLKAALFHAKHNPKYKGESDDEIKQNLINTLLRADGDTLYAINKALKEQAGIAPPLEAEPDNTPATIPAKTNRIARSKTTPVPLMATSEVQAAALVTATYNDQNNWETDLTNLRMTWRYKTHLAIIEAIAPGAWDNLPMTQDADREAVIKGLYNQFSSIKREDSIIAEYVLVRCMENKSPSTMIEFTELLEFEGKTHLGAKEREQRAREYDLAFRFWSVMKPERKGRYKGENIVMQSPLLIYEAPYYKDGQSPFSGIGVYSTPKGFSFVDSSWMTEMKVNPSLTNSIGDLRRIAAIPTGKVAGDWAHSIARTALSLGRINASRTGGVFRLSRRELLTRIPPHTSVESILSGNTPKRARENWEVAKWILKEQKICTIVDPPTEWPRQGWGDPWLNETVEITLAGEALEQAQHIQLQKAKHKDKKPPKPSKPKG